MKGKTHLSPRRRAYDLAGRLLLYISAGATCALLLFMIGTICIKGLPHISWQFLSTAESILTGTIGIPLRHCRVPGHRPSSGGGGGHLSDGVRPEPPSGGGH